MRARARLFVSLSECDIDLKKKQNKTPNKQKKRGITKAKRNEEMGLKRMNGGFHRRNSRIDNPLATGLIDAHTHTHTDTCDPHLNDEA